MTETPQEKQALVLNASGHVLVRGGAGTGKTTLGLQKAIRRINDGLHAGQSVLFLSFSRAAVSRIEQASKIEAPVEKRKFLGLQTFHSFCWELLRTHGYLLGSPKFLSVLSPHDERALSNGIERNHTDWPRWESERVRLFRQHGKVVFDLFAPMAAQLLRRSSLIRNLVAQRFPLMIVDEAQDTWPEAWECVEQLAPLIQVVCLADIEQQIFDHLPGIGPERIAAIETTLRPVCVDLGSNNNRCVGTEIAVFANDVLTGRVRGTPYVGVSRFRYNPRADFQNVIRQAIGILFGKMKANDGPAELSCAILAPYGKGVAKITAALTAGEKPIPHKVLFDEAGVLLSARFAAFLLEPKTDASRGSDVVVGLDLLAAAARASGSKTGIQRSKKLLLWANQLRRGQQPRSGLATVVEALIDSAKVMALSGDPKIDWLAVKRLLKNCPDHSVSGIAANLDYLVAFNRGRRISANLAAMWSNNGCYAQAREALENAIVEDQILAGTEDLTGIHVMTIHRSKGKQFDGVIILREGHRNATGLVSSFVWRDDPAPHPRSRRILRVAITRAIKHVLILDPFFPNCPIISPYTL